MTEDHEHTPEFRERRHYNPAVIRTDAWVCAECEAFLCLDFGAAEVER